MIQNTFGLSSLATYTKMKETPFTDSRINLEHIWFFVFFSLYRRGDVAMVGYIKKHQPITRKILFLLQEHQK